MDPWKTWLVVVFLVIFIRAVVALAMRQPINPVGLLLGGYCGAISGTAMGGITGALVSRGAANLIGFATPHLALDLYRITVYGGISGVIIGTIGGAAVGAIGGSQPGDIEGIPRNILIWLTHITISLAFLTMGIGFTVVLGKSGGLVMYGALSAPMQWYILGGELSKDDPGTLLSTAGGFIIWTLIGLLAPNLGSMLIGAIGAVIVGVVEWVIIGKEIKPILGWWILACTILGGVLGGIVQLFTECVIL